MTSVLRRPNPVPLAVRAGRLAASLGLALLCSATPGAAQSTGGPAVVPDGAPAVPTFEALVLRLDLLEAEVRSLRAQLAAARVATAVDPERVAPILTTTSAAAPLVVPDAHAHAPDEDAGAPDARWQAPSTQIHWFSDVGFSASDRDAATSSFGLGQLDLFLTSKLNDRWTVLSEIVFRANTDNRFVVNPERLLVQYDPSDAVQIAFGRFHSSVGYYNAAYHHGSWFETAATRPSMFAAGLIPYHNVGVASRVRVPSGAAALEVIGEFGNGLASTSRTLESTQSVVDEDNRKAFNLGLVTRPTGLPGLQAGVSWYRDRLHPAGVPSMAAHTTAAHVVYAAHAWELLNELVVARHVPDSGAARSTYGWYSQGAYRIGVVRPYLRYQSVQGHREDPIFGALGHRYGPVAGVRIELGRFAALKLHVDRSRQSTTRTTSHDGVVKLAFTF